jgi:MFS family permease
VRHTFRSLRNRNYRLWSAGALVSNIGTWMQRTAQDWLVLTGLTHHNASAVGLVMALQFGPQLLLLPWTGLAADRMDRRRLLIITQAGMGTLALGLGILTIAGVVQLWHVWLFALLLGCFSAFDAPARQTFVSDLVGETDLSNAVALNSTSFNAARLVGPAIAGLLIEVIGSGWVFIANAASFAAVVGALALLKQGELHHSARLARSAGQLVEGFRYVWNRPDLRAVFFTLFLIGTFGFNFSIYIPTMAARVFHAGAGRYGILASTIAAGSVAGALLAAGRARPHPSFLVGGVTLFGISLAACAAAPNQLVFALLLVVVGASAQAFTTTANSTVQLSTEPAMRGRVMAILLAVTLGGTPIGGPFAGWIADRFGPRWSLAVGALAGLAAAAVSLRYLIAYRNLRLRRQAGRLRFCLDEAPTTKSLLPDPRTIERAIT